MFEPENSSGLSTAFFAIGLIVVVGVGMTALINAPKENAELEEQIEKLEEEVATLKLDVSRVEGKLAAHDIEERASDTGKTGVNLQWDLVEGRIGRALADKRELEPALAQLEEEYRDYSDRVKALIRVNSTGRHLGKLRTASGREYQNAIIKQVTDRSMVIAHDTGETTIHAGEVPRELQERFQWDKNALLYRAAIDHQPSQPIVRFDRPSHPNSVAVSQPSSQEVMEARARLQRAGDIYYSLVRQSSDLQRRASSSSSLSVPGSLKTWEREIHASRQAVARARLNYYKARSDLRLTAPHDFMLRGVLYY